MTCQGNSFYSVQNRVKIKSAKNSFLLFSSANNAWLVQVSLRRPNIASWGPPPRPLLGPRSSQPPLLLPRQRLLHFARRATQLSQSPALCAGGNKCAQFACFATLPSFPHSSHLLCSFQTVPTEKLQLTYQPIKSVIPAKWGNIRLVFEAHEDIPYLRAVCKFVFLQNSTFSLPVAAPCLSSVDANIHCLFPSCAAPVLLECT